MNRKWLIVPMVLALLGLGLSITAIASAAPAYPVCHSGPCYNDPAMLSNEGAWAANIKPRSWYAGQGGSPYLTRLRWHVYKHSKAEATGTLHAQKSACEPKSSCRYYTMKVTVTLSKTKWCNNSACGGGWYYSVMNWAYHGSGYAAAHRWTVRRGFWE